jgi:hypothetical protein
MRYYLIGVYASGVVSPIGVSGHGLVAANRAKAWQITGGFPREMLRIAKPGAWRGYMLAVDDKGVNTGEALNIERGALTETAFNNMLDHIWGDS